MRLPSCQKHYIVALKMPDGGTRHIDVKASSVETAGKRAMKRIPTAVGVRNVEKDS